MTDPTGVAGLRRRRSSLCSGASSPPLSPSLTPRKNDVMYCSTTRSPDSSRVSTFTITDVPFGFTWMPIGAALERSTVPGTIGLWNRMSCSPCTTSMSTSGGTTPAIAPAIVSQIGTTANTGGATSPFDVRGDRVVRRRGVRLRAVGLDLELGSLRPLTQLLQRKAHRGLLSLRRAGL